MPCIRTCLWWHCYVVLSSSTTTEYYSACYYAVVAVCMYVRRVVATYSDPLIWMVIWKRVLHVDGHIHGCATHVYSE